MYYDKKGEPMQSLDWVNKIADASYKIIKKTKVGRDEVSTVWLGLNYNFEGGEPLIFETMVFPDCEICERYTTEEEAIEGHNKIVESLKGD